MDLRDWQETFRAYSVQLIGLPRFGMCVKSLPMLRDGLLLCLAQLPCCGLPVVFGHEAFDPRRKIELQIGSQRKSIRLIEVAQTR
jgi:hypothetical protein